MEENRNAQNLQGSGPPSAGASQNPGSGQGQEKQQQPKEEEFTLRWHLKVLAIIYVALGIFYVILKVTLK